MDIEGINFCHVCDIESEGCSRACNLYICSVCFLTHFPSCKLCNDSIVIREKETSRTCKICFGEFSVKNSIKCTETINCSFRCCIKCYQHSIKTRNSIQCMECMMNFNPKYLTFKGLSYSEIISNRYSNKFTLNGRPFKPTPVCCGELVDINGFCSKCGQRTCPKCLRVVKDSVSYFIFILLKI
mgnify:CR=1 FL=1